MPFLFTVMQSYFIIAFIYLYSPKVRNVLLEKVIKKGFLSLISFNILAYYSLLLYNRTLLIAF